jgi:hypothetical protein
MLGAAAHLQLKFPISSAELCAACISTYLFMAYIRDSLALLLGLRAEMYAALFDNDVIVSKNCFVQQHLYFMQSLLTQCSKQFVKPKS